MSPNIWLALLGSPQGEKDFLEFLVIHVDVG